MSKILYTEEDILKGLNPEQVEVVTSYGQPLLTLASAGSGKAQILTDTVLTPNGFIEMGDTKVGQDVIGSDGEIYQVIGVFPQGKLPVYRVKFDDGVHVDCSNDHLWQVFNCSITPSPVYSSTQVMTTQVIIDNFDQYKFYVNNPVLKCVKFKNYDKQIISIEKLNYDEEMQCISVNSPDKLYITNGYTLTHNTSVLTRKICHLNRVYGTDIDRILAITFTNKASTEMQERVMSLLGLKEKPKWVSTFHSLGVKILRASTGNPNYRNNFQIYDASESNSVLKQIVEKYVDENLLNIDMYSVDNIKGAISKVKLSTDFSIGLSELSDKYSHLEYIFKLYQEAMKQNNALDFDDLLVQSVSLLKDTPNILEKWQNQFDYILVDEYQDTNGIQFELMKLLVGERNKNNLMIVGDIFQVIYTWRNARPENMLEFEQLFENVKTIKLGKNYRSTPNILEFANRILEQSNSSWKDKMVKLLPTKQRGQDVIINQYSSDEMEVQTIINQIMTLIRQGHKYGDVAILLRMSFISRLIEEYMIRYRIPYKIIGGTSFYDRAEIKTLLSYLKFAVNKNDRVSFDRAINTPSRSIGKVALNNIKNHHTTDWLQATKDCIPSMSGISKDNATKFVNLMDSIASISDESPFKAVKIIINKIDYFDYLSKKHPDNFDDRISNVQELINLLQKVEDNHSTFSDFLTDFVLKSAQDEVEDTNKVKIMTIHASKGLEFPIVFIPAVEEGTLPSFRATTLDQLEEERRLFYVAVTRAEKHCLISYTRQRGFARSGNKMPKVKSRFLNGMTNLNS